MSTGQYLHGWYSKLSQYIIPKLNTNSLAGLELLYYTVIVYSTYNIMNCLIESIIF